MEKTYVRLCQFGEGSGTVFELDQLHEMNAVIHNASDKGLINTRWYIEFVKMTEEEFSKLENAE